MVNVLKGSFLAITIVSFMLVNASIISYAQIPTIPTIPTTPTTTSPCTSSMLTSFTPCINYLTNSSSPGTSSPTSDCCNSLRSLMSNGSGCICQIFTGGVPFRIPINRTLAIALPKACNQPGVPVQCKATSGAPLPAPGPTTAFAPTAASPATVVAPGPSASTIPTIEAPALAPVADTTPTSDGSVPTTPTTTSTGSGSGSGSTPTSSASMPSLSGSPAILLCSIALMMIKYF